MVQTSLPSRYRLLEEVGQGGMAVVYRAADESLKREVAIKILHAHLLSQPESKARLEREAQAVAKLHHENILQIFDYSGGDSPTAYIVTEFIDGETLKQFLTRRKLPVPELAALIAMEVGSALQHAHSVGIIHRDVKPENVMVRKDGAVKLMDFGVAQIVDLERMTVTGQILGSPAYMAPEVLEGKPLDCRTDVFSVGIMLYQMATGALPFTGRNPHEVLKRVAEGRFADPRTINRLVSLQLARIISRSLARNPEERYSTIAALLDDLRAYVRDAGFVDSRAELARFFCTPEAYEKDLVSRLVTALVASGQRERVGGRTGRALELWNRALALDPENGAVLRELRRLEGGKRMVRWAVAGGGAVAVVAVVWTAFRLAKDDAAPAVTSAGVVPVRAPAPPRAAPPQIPPPARDDPKPVEVAPAGKPKKVVRTARASAAASSQRVTFTLGPTPSRVAVFHDGRKILDYNPPNDDRIEIPWTGRQELVFRNDGCCEPLIMAVGPEVYRPPNDHLMVKLTPKPALVTFELKPPVPDATLLLTEVADDGKKTGWKRYAVPGEQTAITFDGDDDMRKSLEVAVIVGDKAVHQQRLENPISAGMKRVIPVSSGK